MTSGAPVDRALERIERVAGELAERDIDALLVETAANLRYLTGFTGSHGLALVAAVGAEGSDPAHRFFTDFRYAVAQRFLPPHGPATTVQPVSVPTAGLDVPAGDENVDETKVCRSPVAGVVVKLNVQPGQDIQPNDLMMVLEAMKMETNITAPIAGKVKQVNVAHGDGVKVNQVLVEFE